MKAVIMSQGFTENLACLKEANQHVTTEDFCRCFSENLKDLHQLAFLLTADREKAEQCFVAGLEDCLNSNDVFKKWARSWAERTIIQNAIRTLEPHPDRPSASLSATVPFGGAGTHIRGGPLEIDRVLALDDFERFVFVMSVLVHYSDRDCTLFLSRSIREIREARVRAFQQILGSYQSSSACEIINVLPETK